MPPAKLTPPRVPASAYDEEYFREACGDAVAWDERRAVDGIYAWVVQTLGVGPETTLVDLGSGRGELVVAALLAGARQAIGVEYSPDAIRLAHDTATAHGVAERVEFHQADVRDVPLADALADHATMLDVVEHLTGPELAQALVEAGRVLRPGGTLLVHTMPNRLVYDRTYRAVRALWPRGRRWPLDPRKPIEHQMHVGELSARELRAALTAAGFDDVQVRHGDLHWFGFVPSAKARRLLAWADRLRPLHPLTRGNLLATARRPT